MQEMQQVCMSGTYVCIGSCRLVLHTEQSLICSLEVHLITSAAWAGLQIADHAMQVGESAWVAGIEFDASSPASVQRLMSAAASQMGSVDVWINNAGNSGTFQVWSVCPEKV